MVKVETLDPNKPYIVGQPMELIYWFPVILVRCRCDMTGLKLIILRDLNTPTECPACGRGVMVSGIDADQKPIVLVTAPKSGIIS